MLEGFHPFAMNLLSFVIKKEEIITQIKSEAPPSSVTTERQVTHFQTAPVYTNSLTVHLKWIIYLLHKIPHNSWI